MEAKKERVYQRTIVQCFTIKLHYTLYNGGHRTHIPGIKSAKMIAVSSLSLSILMSYL